MLTALKHKTRKSKVSEKRAKGTGGGERIELFYRRCEKVRSDRRRRSALRGRIIKMFVRRQQYGLAMRNSLRGQVWNREQSLIWLPSEVAPPLQGPMLPGRKSQNAIKKKKKKDQFWWWDYFRTVDNNIASTLPYRMTSRRFSVIRGDDIWNSQQRVKLRKEMQLTSFYRLLHRTR